LLLCGYERESERERERERDERDEIMREHPLSLLSSLLSFSS